MDANKRSALIVTLLMIDRSGYRLQLYDNERIDDLVVAVADSRIGLDALAAWFGQRLRSSKQGEP